MTSWLLIEWKLKKKAKAAKNPDIPTDGSGDSEDSEDLLEAPQEIPIPVTNWLVEVRPTTSYYDDMNPLTTPYSNEEFAFFHYHK